MLIIASSWTRALLLTHHQLLVQGIASECGVTAMPTFQIYRQGKKVEEVRGADVKSLLALLESYNATGGPFSGQGRTLAAGVHGCLHAFHSLPSHFVFETSSFS